MKLVQGLAQPKPLNVIKNALITNFKKPKSESQCNCKVDREVVGGGKGPIVIIVEVIQCKVD
jgi:hypothetical protein